MRCCVLVALTIVWYFADIWQANGVLAALPSTHSVRIGVDFTFLSSLLAILGAWLISTSFRRIVAEKIVLFAVLSVVATIVVRMVIERSPVEVILGVLLGGSLAFKWNRSFREYFVAENCKH